MSHKKKIVSGFLWNLADTVLIQLVSFVVGIVLARKLGPETYGTVAIVSLIISIVQVCTNFCIGTYLMRKKDVDSLDLNTFFYFTLFTNVLIYLIIFFSAPFVAKFYGKSELTILLRIMGISVLLSAHG